MAVILLVEDDQGLREMLKGSLLKNKFQVIEASNGRDAINKFKKTLIELVITDLLMPEQDGIGLIMELRKIKSDLKIIAISGGGKAGPGNYLSIAQALGANAIFTKPFNLNLFIDKVIELTK